MKALVTVSLCALLTFSSGLPCVQAADSPQEIRIGLLTELSGDFAANGEDCRRGFEVARKQVAPGDRLGRYSLNYFYGDSRGSAVAGVTEFKDLVQRQKVELVVATRSLIGMALNPISRQFQVPLLGVVGHPGFVRGNDFAFRFFPSADVEGRALAEDALGKKLFRAALITLEDDYNLSLSESFRKSFEAGGGSIVSTQSVQGSDSDFQPVLTQIRGKQPDVVLMNVGIPQAAALMRRIRELGMTQPLYSNFWAAKPEVREAAGSAAEGLIFVEADLQQPHFRSELKSQFGADSASAVTFSCYSALSAALHALAEPGLVSSGVTFRDALQRLSNVQLLDSELKLVDREIQFPLAYKIIRNKQVETVRPFGS